MDIKELKNKRESDLHKTLAETREKLRDLRFKDASKQLKNVREIRAVRKTIAQVLSLLNNKKENSKPEVVAKAEEVKAVKSEDKNKEEK